MERDAAHRKQAEEEREDRRKKAAAVHLAEGQSQCSAFMLLSRQHELFFFRF